jgi:hypothetical protein
MDTLSISPPISTPISITMFLISFLQNLARKQQSGTSTLKGKQIAVHESNAETIKEKYLKGETEDLGQLKIRKRGNGEKSKDSLDKHGFQEIGRRVHRAQIHR